MNASRASVLCLAILGAPWVRLILHRQARWCPHVLNLLCNWGALSPTPCLPPCYALVFSTLWFPTPSLLHPTSLTPTLDSFPTSQPLSACDYVATLALSSVPPTRSAYTYIPRPDSASPSPSSQSQLRLSGSAVLPGWWCAGILMCNCCEDANSLTWVPKE